VKLPHECFKFYYFILFTWLEKQITFPSVLAQFQSEKNKNKKRWLFFFMKTTKKKNEYEGWQRWLIVQILIIRDLFNYQKKKKVIKRFTNESQWGFIRMVRKKKQKVTHKISESRTWHCQCLVAYNYDWLQMVCRTYHIIK